MAPFGDKANLSEADTCRRFVAPKLLSSGWDDEPHSIAEQRTITDGRIVPIGAGFRRQTPKRVDISCAIRAMSPCRR